ncbi:MAG: hypothetical protein IJ358_03590 [Clostridia bacterium]|nr:hypothetical protein [Clostridia bacterium]
MASKKSTKAYFGLGWVVSIILAIIPFTNVILGIVTRAMRSNWLGLVLNIILCPLFYIIDLVTIIVSKDLTILA